MRINIKQKIMIVMAAFGLLATSSFVWTDQAMAAKCGGIDTAIISCDQNSENPTSASETGVWGLLLLIINIMTAGVGILAVGGIVWASILYASSSDSAEQTKKAKDIIREVAIGIVAYAAMYLLLNFLIPGGIFT